MDDILLDLYYSSVHRNEELELTIEELQKELRYRKNEIREMQSTIDSLDKLSHEVEEKDETINELQTELKYRKNENLNLHKENQYFESRFDELKKENNNLRRNIEYLCDENVRLRHELNEVQNNDNNY